MFKRMIGILAALVLAAGMACTSMAEGTAAGLRFAVTGSDALEEEAAQSAGGNIEGISEAARKAGLAHPVTEEMLLSSGARILREDGKIYMIRSIRELRKVRTAEEAAETAWSLAGLLGGGEDMELVPYARFDIGNTMIYCFCQVRDDVPVYGRTLKIVTDAAGDVNTVISSLAFPEETDESLGAEEDILARMTSEAETPDVPDFDSMIRGEWRCDLESVTGKPGSVTVPVMQDPATGLWYLADPDRKIVTGDFKKMVLDGEKNCLLSSEENGGWDPADVLTYHRIIQCWDYYAQKGLKGPDGQGSPVLLLTNLCMINGESMENACYIGVLGQTWQSFAYSREGNFGSCLDILAHEYAHCLTETSAPGGLYKDDYGAINEAISDILGNICEMQLGETSDMEWYMGENLNSPFRAMSNPHKYNQPEYVWDQFYAPGTLYPNDINDRGGVHTNSSILNYVASRLCLDGGMSLEEALDFWLTVELGLSTRTDYYQMADLLEWAMETAGLDRYRESLKALTEKTRMTLTRQPDTVPDGQMRVELTLPDTEAMKDHHWLLMGIQIRVWEAVDLVLDLITGSNEDLPDFVDLMEMLASEEAGGTEWASPEIAEIRNRVNAVFSLSSSWVSKDGDPITMILERGKPTIYILLNMDPNTVEPRSLLFLIANEWVDLGILAADDDEELDGAQAMEAFSQLGRLAWGLLLPENTELKVLPGTGLESIELPPLSTD